MSNLSVIGWPGERMIDYDGECIGVIDGGPLGPYTFRLFSKDAPGLGPTSASHYLTEKACAFAALIEYRKGSDHGISS